MSDKIKIIQQYKNILKCFFFFIASVIVYLLIIKNYSETVFVNRISFFMFLTHYLILLTLLLTFMIVITLRLYHLSKMLYQTKMISLKPMIVIVGFFLSFIVPFFFKPMIAVVFLPLTLFSYLLIFWTLGNKYLKTLSK